MKVITRDQAVSMLRECNDGYVREFFDAFGDETEYNKMSVLTWLGEIS